MALLGLGLLLLGCYVASAHKKQVAWPLVVKALALHLLLAVCLLQWPMVRQAVAVVGQGIEALQKLAAVGGGFVFGGFISQPQALDKLFGPGGHFVFALQLIPTLVFIATLVAIGYYWKILPKVVQAMAWLMHKLVGLSGPEALSNCASVFVGQVEAQLLIKPYLAGLSRSQLLTVMCGSFACISGGMLAVYIGMGVSSMYLLSASVLAIPGSVVIAKLLEPELPHEAALALEAPLNTPLDAPEANPHPAVNVIDAAAQGAMEGWHIALSVLAMLIAFLSLMALGDALLGQVGLWAVRWGLPPQWAGLDWGHLSVATVMGLVFYPVALLLGIPAHEALGAAACLGEKLVLNEFVAYRHLLALTAAPAAGLSPLSQAILSVALCGFANIGSVAIQLGGIGTMVPQRRGDLAALGLKAMVAGNLASYLSALVVGLLLASPQVPTLAWVALAVALWCSPQAWVWAQARWVKA